MALIDKSYFVGDITIPNTDKDYVLERLNRFIDVYQEDFLRDLLGYPLYKAFMAGLLIDPVESRFNSILTGAEYTTASGKLRRWNGLIETVGGVTVSLTQPGYFEMTVGGTDTYDAVDGSTTVKLPPAYRNGVQFYIEQRGVGQLKAVEYRIITVDESLDTLELLVDLFDSGDTYFYKTIISVGVSPSADIAGRSIIADYVYWQLLRDSASNTTTLGEAAALAENAGQISPAQKMVRAWNSMSRKVREFLDFMRVNKDTYPEWDNTFQHEREAWARFRHNNIFGI